MKKEKDPDLEINAILDSLNECPELQTRPNFWPSLENRIHQNGHQTPPLRHWIGALTLGLTLILNLISVQTLHTKDGNPGILQNSSTELSENRLFEQNTEWMNYLLLD
ncbi:MAG: hypothetical protein AAF598_08615 [Bacteroidota bacterium]